jgi:hypothetical protein
MILAHLIRSQLHLQQACAGQHLVARMSAVGLGGFDLPKHDQPRLLMLHWFAPQQHPNEKKAYERQNKPSYMQ